MNPADSVTTAGPMGSAGTEGTRSSVDPTPPAPPPRARLPEIDGLRAIALTLVVVYHLFGQGRVSGGVDVFLFVSGVVLALSLESAIARGETAAVWRRWARTFGRLAPPAALVLLAVVAMSFTILPPWQRDQTMREVVSSAVYLENWQLIASQLSYGAAGPETSPVQHFWSLSIQGQLIIVVPLAVALIFAARRWLRKPPAVVRLLVAGAVLGSFAYAAVRHATDPAVAYFDTFARFWELGLGLMIGWALAMGLRLPRRASALLGWTGLAAVLLSGVIIDGAQAYPGPLALVPVGGAALVVLSIRADGRGPEVVLRSRAFGAFSKTSYSLYLWHWPVLIAFLAISQRVDGVLGWRGAALVLVISVGLAVATWGLLERPLANRLRTARPLASGGVALLAVGIVIVVATAGLLAPRAAEPDSAAEAPAPVAAEATCLGAAALDPLRPECHDAADPDAALLPAYDRLTEDDDNRPECWGSLPEHPYAVCTLGPAEGYSRHLLAVGDSHNNVFVGVYEQIALDNGWRIDVAGRPGCHWTDATRVQNNLGATEGCADWNSFIEDYIAEQDLDGVIVTNSSRAEYVVPEGESPDDVRAEGFARAWDTRPDPAIEIFAIRDNPIFPIGALPCVIDPVRVEAGACGLPREEALIDDGLADAVELDPNARLIDLTDYMCDPTWCSLVVGGVIVSRDGSHLTATFAQTLRPYLERELQQSLAP
ncbi:acyltransferase family protein [Microbacterium sp. SSM24]|uniref:acyltransferase family protein n=1 Tax=Microbacterium sp. SSM24 TaxID=2991714 RepID=UPI0022270714|nr:acyltransferase family protein [Microbacterium sp. SSM24]MCW3493766.1 acyltransferase [Microbacterium sp. SSM24]